MESSKKLYILIGSLILVVLALFLSRFFIVRKPQKEEVAVSSCPNQITYQGVVYNIIDIGGQCWLAENLRVANYRNGITISKLTDSTEWAKDKEGAYSCYYNQDKYCQDYGALYNWYAVNNKAGLCPEGWSVPTDEQWTKVSNDGFKAILGGFRNSAGPYSLLDEQGFWWTSTSSGDFALARVMEKDNSETRSIESNKSSGFSVRCIKN